MGKKKFITAAICILFIVFSGIIYLKPGTGGSKNASFTINATDTGSDILQKAGTESSKVQEAEVNSSTLKDTEEITVYICGAVKHPGVYSLLNGQRVCDAVSAAGGFKKSAARSAVNLAKVMSDGEQVTVLSKKQAASNKKSSRDNKTGLSKEGMVNINTASREELMTLPGIGESKADAVIEYRLSGSFKNIEDIKNVTGIKDGIFNKIKDQITV